MELFFVTRGIKSQVDMFIKGLETWTHPIPRKNIKTNIIEQGGVQGGVRPLQIWSYVFPKEQLNLVLNRIRPNIEFTGAQANLNKYASFFRKILGAEKIPEWDANAARSAVELGPDVQRLGIGMRDDPTKIFGDYEYEAL